MIPKKKKQIKITLKKIYGEITSAFNLDSSHLIALSVILIEILLNYPVYV